MPELIQGMKTYPQFIKSAAIPFKPDLDDIPEVAIELSKLRNSVSQKADINLRYSGTENKIRLSVRGFMDDDQDNIDKQASLALDSIANSILNLWQEK